MITINKNLIRLYHKSNNQEYLKYNYSNSINKAYMFV